MRKGEILLHTLNRLQKSIRPMGCNQHCGATAKTAGSHKVCRKQRKAMPCLVVDVGLASRANHADGTLPIPHGIDPITEILAIPDRHLQHPKRGNRWCIHL